MPKGKTPYKVTETTEPFTVLVTPDLKAAVFERARIDDCSAGSVGRRALKAFVGERPTRNGGATP